MNIVSWHRLPMDFTMSGVEDVLALLKPARVYTVRVGAAPWAYAAVTVAGFNATRLVNPFAPQVNLVFADMTGHDWMLDDGETAVLVKGV